MEPHGGSGKILRIFSRRKMKADNPLRPSPLSFNGRHNKDRDQFLREKRSDQSLARLVI